MSTGTVAQSRAEEVSEKIDRVRAFLDSNSLSGALFTAQNNVSWITAGMEDLVVRGHDPGFVYTLITRDGAYVLTQNIEGPRLLAEEKVDELGYELRMYPWWTEGIDKLIAGLCDTSRLANDGFGPGRPMPNELQQLRLTLTSGEQQRLRELGADCCAVIEQETAGWEPGITERQLAARIVAGLEERGIFPIVLLVGGDERRRTFRHPTTSDTPLRHDVLTILVGVRGGLNVALSRTASAGPTDPTLAERHHIASQVEAVQVAASRPGSTWEEALQAGIDACEAAGYREEWQHHYQGGPIGYGPREFLPTPRGHRNRFSQAPIVLHQAFSWNPTVQGAKSEDTFIVQNGPAEPISNSDSWPMVRHETPVGPVLRPGIQEI